METTRSCGCKGIRTCLLCEAEFQIRKEDNLNKDNGVYSYCPFCNKCWEGYEVNDYLTHPNHEGRKPYDFPGVYIQLDFLTVEEEAQLVEGIEGVPWVPSQSGRRKQNYGPKCNFKKRKLQLGDFTGFPEFSKFVQQKLNQVNILRDFQTIEQCSLEYNPDRGAAIDPHIDDCWVWGERIVTVNLEADSVLTMTYNKRPDRYNLSSVVTYPSILREDGSINETKEHFKIHNDLIDLHPVVRVPMPRRSLLVMYGSARYDWEHRILREDIKSRRICLAYREFTPTFLPGGNQHEQAKPILKMACNFITT